MGSEVVLSALAIVATIAGALVWLLKKLFEQNSTTLKSLSESLDKNSDALTSLRKSLNQRDAESNEISTKIVRQLETQEKVLKKISNTQDELVQKLSPLEV